LSFPRVSREKLEREMLSPLASLAEQSKGRVQTEPECEIRTCYQRDVDRITHSKAFRRLKHKTQVFLQPEGDHYRTRLTHTLEVARIGRTIARALRLNEDLTEAIALGHDLGHTPFGHSGERALNGILDGEGGFRHNEQSVRVVEKFEKDGKGLNLTFEVKDGIMRHTGELLPETQEGRIIRIADRIAYINHDVDDAIRAGILREMDIPEEITCAFGARHSDRINTLIRDVINESEKSGEIGLSPQATFVFDSFRDFMFSSVYRNMKAKSEEAKVFSILDSIFRYYVGSPDEMPVEYRRIATQEGMSRAVSDYVSGMTDKYAIYTYEDLFIPKGFSL
jgi:dGTPase